MGRYWFTLGGSVEVEMMSFELDRTWFWRIGDCMRLCRREGCLICII